MEEEKTWKVLGPVKHPLYKAFLQNGINDQLHPYYRSRSFDRETPYDEGEPITVTPLEDVTITINPHTITVNGRDYSSWSVGMPIKPDEVKTVVRSLVMWREGL